MLNDIQNLIKFNEELIKNIENCYNESIQKKTIDENMKVQIKNFLENCRSVLDYTWKLKTQKGSNFPMKNSKNDFDNDRELASIDTNTKNFFQKYQPYNKEIMKEFSALVNQNKHSNLTPQIIRKNSVTQINHPNGQIAYRNDEQSEVQLGLGVSFFGVPINPDTQLPYPNNSLDTKVEEWSSIVFGDITNKNVLNLIQEIHKLIIEITSELLINS